MVLGSAACTLLMLERSDWTNHERHQCTTVTMHVGLNGSGTGSLFVLYASCDSNTGVKTNVIQL
jgi:hypothetical protein